MEKQETTVVQSGGLGLGTILSIIFMALIIPVTLCLTKCTSPKAPFPNVFSFVYIFRGSILVF